MIGTVLNAVGIVLIAFWVLGTPAIIKSLIFRDMLRAGNRSSVSDVVFIAWIICWTCSIAGYILWKVMA